MKELIMEKHGKKGTTTTRIKKKQQAIYGIWVTEGINISEGVYLLSNQGPSSDHRPLWVSIHHPEALVEAKLPIRDTAARKLIIQHPRGQGR